jgi:hypothetical protein
MSIYSLMRRQAAADAGPGERRPPLQGPGGPSEKPDVVALLADRIPAEAVALYTGVLAFLVPDDTPLDKQSYGARWVVAAVVSVIAVLYAVGTYRRAVLAGGGRFRWPIGKTVVVFVAFWAWVAVIPGSPFGAIDGYTPTIGAVVGLLLNGLLGALALFSSDAA